MFNRFPNVLCKHNIIFTKQLYKPALILMSILNLLATNLNRKDEAPNMALANQIANTNDKAAVEELIQNLSTGSKNIQHDCIKVLYETGALDPALIVKYTPIFVGLLSDKNNRLQWGAMTALQSIAVDYPKDIYTFLPAIMIAATDGSVITKDNLVKLLVHLSKNTQYRKNTMVLLNELLASCATNQLPMYAEYTLPVIDTTSVLLFVQTLKSRLPEIEKESKRKRVEKVIQKCSGQFL
jgi:hypothetical protein